MTFVKFTIFPEFKKGMTMSRVLCTKSQQLGEYRREFLLGVPYQHILWIIPKIVQPQYP